MDTKSKTISLIGLRKDRNIRLIKRQQETMEKTRGSNIRITLQLLQSRASPQVLC